MSAPPSGGGTPIENRRQLIEYFAAGNKPPAAWRMGTEHEKFGFHTATLKPLAYDGPDGIRAMLEGMTRFGWEPVVEGNNPIALQRANASITLEPGGQFELSGAPLETLHETAEENEQHLDEVKEVAGEIGAGFIGLGFAPEWRREDMHWMPKGRYKIMRDYMPKKGKLGIDMMLRTCTVQTNLDFESEADMVKKFRVSLALQPLATALFANSPFKEGKAVGYKSYRSHIWTDTDPDRCGMLPFVFEDGFGFERYVDYMLDVPMYFVYRDGKYIDASGQDFRAFLKGKLPARPGELPTVNDWADHITTAFPEVRLKRYLEMRGADSGPLPALNALPALWVGLLYDRTALDAAWDLVKDWTAADHDFLRAETPKTGLSTIFRGRSLTEWAREVVEIAHAGLRARKRLDAQGNDETIYLAPLDRAVASRPGAGRRAPGQVAGRVEGLLRAAVPRLRLLRYRRAMLDRCDRVQIAVHDAAKAAQRFGLLLGGEIARRDHSRHLRARRTILAVGESEFELCEPDGAGLTQDFLAKRGEGLMTAGYCTADLDGMVKRWEGLGVPYDRDAEQLYLAPGTTFGLPMVISETTYRPRVGPVSSLYETTNTPGERLAPRGGRLCRPVRARSRALQRDRQRALRLHRHAHLVRSAQPARPHRAQPGDRRRPCHGPLRQEARRLALHVLRRGP